MERNFLNIDDRAVMEREALDARLAPQREREAARLALQHPAHAAQRAPAPEALRQRGGDATAPDA